MALSTSRLTSERYPDQLVKPDQVNPDQVNPDQVNPDRRIDPIFVVSYPSFKMTPLAIPATDETESGKFGKTIEFTLVGEDPGLSNG